MFYYGISIIVTYLSYVLAYTLLFQINGKFSFFFFFVAIPTLELPFLPQSILYNIPFRFHVEVQTEGVIL